MKNKSVRVFTVSSPLEDRLRQSHPTGPPTRRAIDPFHLANTDLFQRSSSSPPQPQNALGKPLTLRNCSTVRPLTPPKNSRYGRLQESQKDNQKPQTDLQPPRSLKRAVSYSHVHVFVKFGRKVSGHLAAAIIVAVVLRDMVNVVEDQAVPVQILHSLQEAHIEEHGSVKGLAPALTPDKQSER